MDYEKKYKNALAWAKQVISGEIGFIRNEVEDVFPELKESEDERIRKGIIRCVKGNMPDNDFRKKFIAWLEKQGKKDMFVKKELESIKGYRKKAIKMLEEMEKQGKKLAEEYNITGIGSKHAQGKLGEMINNLEKQGEQKPTDKGYTFKSIPRLLDMIQPTDRAESYCQKLIDSLEQEGYSIDAKIVRACLKQMNGEKVAMATMDEQNSTWSEEDEEMIDAIISNIQFAQKAHNHKVEQVVYEREIDWLKSLKDKVQLLPKQEWSKEDDRHKNTIIRAIHGAGNITPIEGELAENWLKSLRPQNRWKPSEGQMEALMHIRMRLAVEKSGPSSYLSALDDLFNDLKKLREE